MNWTRKTNLGARDKCKGVNLNLEVDIVVNLSVETDAGVNPSMEIDLGVNLSMRQA